MAPEIGRKIGKMKMVMIFHGYTINESNNDPINDRGTTPDHIRAVANSIKGIPPRKRKVGINQSEMLLSGLEKMRIGALTNFVNIGERCNVAGSRKFCRLIKNNQYDVSN